MTASQKVNEWISKNALKHELDKIPAIIKEKFDYTITRNGVRKREQVLGIRREPVRAKEKPLEQAIHEDRAIRKLREETGSYKKKYEHVLTDLAFLEREVEAARAIGDHSSVFPIEPKNSTGETEAVAVAVASDWHVEEVVNPHTVNNLNKYNPDIAKKRSIRFFQLVERMIRKERQDVVIHKLVLFLGGDFISGNIHESLLITCDMSPIHAAEYARELLESGIRFLLENTNLELIIPCSIGNHSRITKKVITGDEAGNSVEWLIYGALARAFENEKRVRFILSESYLNTVPILGLKVRFHHGHAVKFGGGVGGLTIPLNKAIYRWNQTDKVDLDVLGHFHQYTSMRQFVVNGSLIGTTDYGLRLGFENEPPTQGMFLIDQKRGKTISIPLFCGE